MATSGSTDWVATRSTIITQAYRLIGALGESETISATQLSFGVDALNPMVKFLMTKGMPVWAIKETTVALSTFSTSTVEIGPSSTIAVAKPLKILQAYRRDTSLTPDVDVPLTILTWEDYNRLSAKEQEGTPSQLFYQPKNYVGSIAIWPRPDTYWTTNGSLIIRYQKLFEDFDAAADNPDFPVEWHEPLAYQLAVRLAPMYGLAPNDRQILVQEAGQILKGVLDFDQEEGSIFVQPARRR